MIKSALGATIVFDIMRRVFASRHTNRPVQFLGRGASLLPVVDVLNCYISGEAGENVLLWKWVEDLTQGAVECVKSISDIHELSFIRYVNPHLDVRCSNSGWFFNTKTSRASDRGEHHGSKTKESDSGRSDHGESSYCNQGMLS